MSDFYNASNLLPKDGEVYLLDSFLDPERADVYLKLLLETIQWHQDEIKLFGKTHLAPRLSAWYGEEGLEYSYSGVQLQALPWTDELKKLGDRVSDISEQRFNSVLLNLYRFGQDSMGWHADDELELGHEPVIASISLGQERMFHLRHKQDHTLKVKIPLPHGSLLLMKGATQHFWQHHIPKSKKPMQARINLTFRKIISV